MGNAAVGLVLLLGALSKRAIRIALKFCSRKPRPQPGRLVRRTGCLACLALSASECNCCSVLHGCAAPTTAVGRPHLVCNGRQTDTRKTCGLLHWACLWRQLQLLGDMLLLRACTMNAFAMQQGMSVLAKCAAQNMRFVTPGMSRGSCSCWTASCYCGLVLWMHLDCSRARLCSSCSCWAASYYCDML